MTTILILSLLWVIAGLLNVLLIGIKPPTNVKHWGLLGFVIGPIGIAYFLVRIYKRILS